MKGNKKFIQILTTGLFRILRARFAYFKVLRVSSALMSAGLIQAGIEQEDYQTKAPLVFDMFFEANHLRANDRRKNI